MSLEDSELSATESGKLSSVTRTTVDDERDKARGGSKKSLRNPDEDRRKDQPFFDCDKDDDERATESHR